VKPSIILITCDELRRDALSCYGGQAVQTPNLDRLAASGVRFDRAYTASPVCLPSRSSILTGLYPHNHRAYSNFRDCSLSPEIPNLYRQLGNNGYHTGHIGKCHYVPVPYSQTKHDQTQPDDAFRAHYLSLGMHDLILQDGKHNSLRFYDDYSTALDAAGYLSAYRDEAWKPANRKVFSFPGPAEWHPDSWVGRWAREYVDGYTDPAPLFLWVSFSGPHYPFDAPAAYLERVNEAHIGAGAYEEGEFDEPTRIHHASFHGPGGIDGAGSAPDRACKNYTDDYWHRLRRQYFANVALIDDQVGLLLASLERRFGDNTMIVFTTDHGELLGNHRLWGKNNCAYEDVWNVPLLLRYPGTEGGSDGIATDGVNGTDGAAVAAVHERVSLIDIAPTCLRTAGVEGAKTDGVDLREVIASGGRPHVICETSDYLAVSDGEHKLIHFRRGETRFVELFDLKRDPGEFRNVAQLPEYSAARAKLSELIAELFVDTLLS